MNKQEEEWFSGSEKYVTFNLNSEKVKVKLCDFSIYDRFKFIFDIIVKGCAEMKISDKAKNRRRILDELSEVTYKHMLPWKR